MVRHIADFRVELAMIDDVVPVPAAGACLQIRRRVAIGDAQFGQVRRERFCIDRYEFPNQPGNFPRVGAAFTEAEALCQKAGKRLCSEDEWEKACKGPDELRFPYDNQAALALWSTISYAEG